MKINNIKKKKYYLLDINNIEKKKKINIFYIINILAKRSYQLEYFLKLDFNKKIKNFNNLNSKLEKFFLNKEQIEISKFFEKLPKSTLISIYELLNNKIIYYYNNKKN
ncbi:MAG: hypothetical protein NHG02_01115 [Candidatus Shikimatogenerans bostrichidophilus]|nr:MAG: hypothetical protein NHG02_01115 [Candidatus Shikimatogenerans bostrichidophilus]